VRLGAFLLFLTATLLMSLGDGLAAHTAAFLFATAGATLIASRHLRELAASDVEEPDVRVRVVRWNY